MRRVALVVSMLLVAVLLPGGVAGAQVPLDPGVPSPASFSQVTAGSSHSCGLTGAGIAWCWGSDGFGRLGNGATVGDQVSPSPVDTSGLPDGTTFTQLVAGNFHSCGLTSAGTAWCWGDDGFGRLGNGATVGDQVSPSAVDTSGLPDGTTFTQLAAGTFHSCGLTGAGTAWCWGSDGFGRLGNGATVGDQVSPSAVDTSGLPDGTTFTQLAAGNFHSCGLTSAGTAWCWGDDGFGRLGNGATVGDQVSPSAVDTSGLSPGTTFTQLAAGNFHSCGLTGAGTAWCWGDDGFGRLGNGATGGDQVSPSAVDISGLPDGTTFNQLAAGNFHSCGLTGAGTAWCWGSDGGGRLGNGAPGGDQVSPSAVDISGLPAGTTFTQLAAGILHSCGLTGAGTAWCWGSDGFGQLGNGATVGDQVSPSPVDTSGLPAGTTFTQLAAGILHTCGLTGAGTAWCWGDDDFGQLGNGATAGDQVSPSPVDISGLPAGTTFTQLTAGILHTCGLTGAGTAWCWGDDIGGQLGNGATAGDQVSPSPVDISDLPAGTTFTQLTAGNEHSCGLTGAGTAWCWGDDDFGQLGNGANGSQVSPSELDISGLSLGTTFTQLTAGILHSCGLTGAGTAWCWGDDDFGRLGNGANGDQVSPSAVDTIGLPAGTTFTELRASYEHSCGLTGAGTAWCWGYDGFEQLGNGATAGDQVSPSPVDISGLPDGTTFTQLTAGVIHSCGLTGAGTAWCWGDDGFGQLGNGATGGDQVTPSPVDISGLSPGTTFTQLTAYYYHSCGLTGAGTAWCWGFDSDGQLGNGATGSQVSPSPLDTAVSVVVADASVTVGEMVTLTAETSGVGPASLRWFRDGVVVAGQTDRTYTFTAEVADRDVVFTAVITNVFNRNDSDTARVTVNIRPVADAGGPYTVAFGGTVTVDASGSSDADGDVLTYVWELDGDASRFDDPTSATPVFDVAGLAAGDHTIAVTVDDGRDSDSDTATVTVYTPPVVGPAGSADLGVTVEAPTVSDGESVFPVEVVVSNAGPSAGGGTLTLTAPSAAAVAAVPADCSQTGAMVSCVVATLQVGGSVTTIIEATAPGTYIATIAGTLPDPQAANDTASATVAQSGPSAPSGSIGGNEPIETAIVISQQRFPASAQSRGRASHVVLSRVDVFADSLAGSVLTGDAPLLFTAGDQLDDRTLAEIDRLLDGAGTVYLLGGEQALSAAVAEAITAAGATTVRLAGPSRVETALAVADAAAELYGAAGMVAIARAHPGADDASQAWADSVAAGVWAADTASPILLTPTEQLHPAVAGWLQARPDPERVLLGGTAALSDAVAEQVGVHARHGGANRYATAALLAEQLWADTSGAFTLTAGDHPDGWAYALAGAGLGADTASPLLLAETDRLPVETETATCPGGSRAAITIIGGTDIIAQTVRDALTRPCT